MRAWNVRNSWVTKVAQGERSSAGFFDSSVVEAAERENVETLKTFLRNGLKNTSVTCVLVGQHTALRRWVRYEIFRSFMRGNGLLAVRINSIATPKVDPRQLAQILFAAWHLPWTMIELASRST